MKLVKLLLFIFLVLFLLSCAESAFNRAKIENSVHGYEQFIRRFPQSEYIAEAERLKEEAIYRHAFAYSKHPDDLEIAVIYLESYIDLYPNGNFTKSAKVQVDDILFGEAKKRDTIDSYKKYIENSKYQFHLKMAKERIDELTKEMERLKLKKEQEEKSYWANLKELEWTESNKLRTTYKDIIKSKIPELCVVADGTSFLGIKPLTIYSSELYDSNIKSTGFIDGLSREVDSLGGLEYFDGNNFAVSGMGDRDNLSIFSLKNRSLITDLNAIKSFIRTLPNSKKILDYQGNLVVHYVSISKNSDHCAIIIGELRGDSKGLIIFNKAENKYTWIEFLDNLSELFNRTTNQVFSDYGKFLFISNYDEGWRSRSKDRFYILDIGNKMLFKLNYEGPTNFATFSPDGEVLVLNTRSFKVPTMNVYPSDYKGEELNEIGSLPNSPFEDLVSKLSSISSIDNRMEITAISFIHHYLMFEGGYTIAYIFNKHGVYKYGASKIEMDSKLQKSPYYSSKTYCTFRILDDGIHFSRSCFYNFSKDGLVTINSILSRESFVSALKTQIDGSCRYEIYKNALSTKLSLPQKPDSIFIPQKDTYEKTNDYERRIEKLQKEHLEKKQEFLRGVNEMFSDKKYLKTPRKKLVTESLLKVLGKPKITVTYDADKAVFKIKVGSDNSDFKDFQILAKLNLRIGTSSPVEMHQELKNSSPIVKFSILENNIKVLELKLQVRGEILKPEIENQSDLNWSI
ncbi:hypothetical protein KKA14_18790 [bacterium]|nr:hypothetical protein [bacterium]